MVKTGCSPKMLRSTAAATAAATTIHARTAWSKSPTTSSIVNVTAAIGALKAAAIPAAAPTGRSRLRLSRYSAAARPNVLATPAQI